MGPEVRLPWASIRRQLEAGARAGRAMGAPRTWERRLCRPQWTPPDPPSRRACDGAGQPRGWAAAGTRGCPRPLERTVCGAPSPCPLGWGLGVFEGPSLTQLFRSPSASPVEPGRSWTGRPIPGPQSIWGLLSRISVVSLRAEPVGQGPQPRLCCGKVTHLQASVFPAPGWAVVVCPKGMYLLGTRQGPGNHSHSRAECAAWAGGQGRRHWDGTGGHRACFSLRQPYFRAALVLGAASEQSGWGLWRSGQLCRAEGPRGTRRLGLGAVLCLPMVHGALGVACPPVPPPLLTSRAQPPATWPADTFVLGACRGSRDANIPGLLWKPAT